MSNFDSLPTDVLARILWDAVALDMENFYKGIHIVSSVCLTSKKLSEKILSENRAMVLLRVFLRTAKKYWRSVNVSRVFNDIPCTDSDCHEIILYLSRTMSPADWRKNPNVLDAACKLGFTTVVRHLLDIGVDPNGYSRYAFVNACENGHEDIVQLLYDRGCDPQKKRHFGPWSSFSKRISVNC